MGRERRPRSRAEPSPAADDLRGMKEVTARSSPEGARTSHPKERAEPPRGPEDASRGDTRELGTPKSLASLRSNYSIRNETGLLGPLYLARASSSAGNGSLPAGPVPACPDGLSLVRSAHE